MLLSCYLNLLKNKYFASLSFSGIRKIFIQDRKNNLKYLKSIKIVLSERLSQNRSPYSKRADLIIKQTSWRVYTFILQGWVLWVFERQNRVDKSLHCYITQFYFISILCHTKSKSQEVINWSAALHQKSGYPNSAVYSKYISSCQL
jgi:hypothetical protein